MTSHPPRTRSGTARRPVKSRRRALVITGGAGFIGCNLADRMAREGHHVIVFDSLKRAGVEANLDWLAGTHKSRISFVKGDVRDPAALEAVVRDAAGVFHLAAQTAVTVSLGDVRGDADVNLVGTINVLEAARKASSPPPVLFASTNKVYGDLADVALVRSANRYEPADPALALSGISERRALSFHTPYGCSKGAADQYVLDYAKTFGLRAAVLRMSCIYGPHQCGTEDQGWVAHFAACVLEGRPISLFGDGCQVRDILYVGDAVSAYARCFERIDDVSGRAFNLGGGPANAVSLLEVIDCMAELTGLTPEITFSDWRPADQRYYVSDTRAISGALELPTPLPWREGVPLLLSWLRGGRQNKGRRRQRRTPALDVRASL